MDNKKCNKCGKGRKVVASDWNTKRFSQMEICPNGHKCYVPTPGFIDEEEELFKAMILVEVNPSIYPSLKKIFCQYTKQEVIDRANIHGLKRLIEVL
jgi:hypothetical protein